MTDIVISVDHLGKQYRLGQRRRYKTLRDSLAEMVAFPYRWMKSRASQQDAGSSSGPPFVWALKDLSFDIPRGEAVGVIGRNGAGKSTLLKILSRITEPTRGQATIRGRVGSLLDVGTGFHPELTGRENVYLNGAIIGMKKAEINRKFDEIVAFAEVERFLDTPVKHYSSGMYMRLAFAVAAHLEPEILFVDEVLAVGDSAFQKKCLGKMNDIANAGRTVLFVSHNLASVNALCHTVLWLDEGLLKVHGQASEVVSAYVTAGQNLDARKEWPQGIASPGVNVFRLLSVCIRNASGTVTTKLEVHKSFSVEISYVLNEDLIPFSRVGFLIRTLHGVTVFETYDSDDERYSGERRAGTYSIRCDVPAEFLNDGTYVLSVNAGMPAVMNLVFVEDVLVFDIEDTRRIVDDIYVKREGIVRPSVQWNRKAVEE